MGSEYRLFIDKDDRSVYIGEMSNRLAFYVADKEGEVLTITDDMEPADMLRALLEGIKATSYWMPESEFNKVFSELETFPFEDPEECPCKGFYRHPNCPTHGVKRS